MSKSVTEWLLEGESLFEAGVAECRAIEDRIGQLEQMRAERWVLLEQAARMLGRSVVGVTRPRVTQPMSADAAAGRTVRA